MLLDVSSEMVRNATEVTPPMFGTLRWITGSQRSALLRNPTKSRKRDLNYAIKKCLATHSRTRALWGAVARTLLAILAIVAAVPCLPQILHGWNPAWLAFAVAALATVPYDALGTVFQAGARHEPILSIRRQGP